MRTTGPVPEGDATESASAAPHPGVSDAAPM